MEGEEGARDRDHCILMHQIYFLDLSQWAWSRSLIIAYSGKMLTVRVKETSPMALDVQAYSGTNNVLLSFQFAKTLNNLILRQQHSTRC